MRAARSCETRQESRDSLNLDRLGAGILGDIIVAFIGAILLLLLLRVLRSL